MKVYEIIAEKYYPHEEQSINEGKAGAALGWALKKGKSLIKPNSANKGLGPKSKAGKNYRDTVKKNKADMLAKNQAAKEYAQKKMSAMPTAGSALVSLAGIGYYVNDYFEAIAPLEADWEAYINNGNQAEPPNRFAGMAYPEALEQAQSDRNALLGKATLGMLTSTGFVGKFVSWMGKVGQFSGLLTKGVTPAGGAVIQSAGKILTGVGNLIQKLTGSPAARVALIAFMESPMMKPIIESAIAYAVFANVGWFTDKVLAAITNGYKLLQQFAKEKLNINLPNLPSFTEPKIKPDPNSEKERQIQQDQRLKNLINGVDVTDTQGFLTTDRLILSAPMVQLEISTAKRAGQPHPLAKFKRKPGAEYPEDLIQMY